MKNLLGKNEFKKLKSYDKLYDSQQTKSSYDKLYESMDFSNNTGWSESLLGRAVNKLFSFGKTLVEKLIMKKLKRRLEDTYFQGVMVAMAKNNIDANAIETVNLMVDVFLVNDQQVQKIKVLKEKAGSDELDLTLIKRVLDYDWQTPSEYNNKIFSFKVKSDTDLNGYSYLIVPHYDNVELIDNNTDIPEKIENVKETENLEDITVVVVEGKNDEKTEQETYFIKTIKDNVKGNNDNNEFKAEFEESISEDKTASFTDNSSGEPNSWKWTFEGAETTESTEQNPTVKYDNPGKYKVTLTISNDDGKTDTIEKEIEITDNLPATTFNKGDLVKWVSIPSANKQFRKPNDEVMKSDEWVWDFGIIVDKNSDGTYQVRGIPGNRYFKWNSIVAVKSEILTLVLTSDEVNKIKPTWEPKKGEEIAIVNNNGDIETGDVDAISKTKNQELVKVNNKTVPYKWKPEGTKNGKKPEITAQPKEMSNDTRAQLIKKKKEEGQAELNKIMANSKLKKETQGLIYKAQDVLDKFMHFSRTEEEVNAAWEVFQKIINKIEVSEVSENFNNYNYFLINKELKEFTLTIETFFNKINEAVSNEKSKGKNIKNSINKFLLKSKIKKAVSGKLSNLLSSTKLSKENADLLKAYGPLDIDSLDQKGIAKKFIEDDNLRKIATESVNKEALKEIQLRAQWMYDPEKYKDKRTEHYSRLNFTTTGADSNKLENFWLKKLARVKADYTVFFQEGGNFPQSLDPPALVNSDAAFRKTWNQYDAKEANKNSTQTSTDNVPPVDDKVLKFLHLIKGSPKPGAEGLLKIYTTNKQTVGILFKLIKGTGNFYCFKFLGLFDWGKYYKEWKNLSENDQTEEKSNDLVEKYHYTTGGNGKTTSINSADNEDIKNIFYSFRGKILNNEKITVKTDTIGFYYRTKINKPSSGGYYMPQVILHKNNTWENATAYITKTKNEFTEIAAYEPLKEVSNNVGNKESHKKQYKFNFNTDNIFYMETSSVQSLWSIIIDKEDADKDKALSNLTDIENIL